MIIKKIFIILFLLNSSIVYGSVKYIIKDIQFKGLQRISVNNILPKILFHIGDTITDNDISKTIHSLFNTKNFEEIRVLRDNDILIFEMKERPIITNILFFGNKLLTKDILIQNLEYLNIKNGEVLNYNAIFNLKKKLKDFYYNIGNYNTVINTEIILLPHNCVNLKLVFSEGTSAKIQKINILGNYNFSKKELISYFQLHEKTKYCNLINNCKYKKNILLNDLKNLQNFYLNHGYINFNIESTQINLTPDKNNIDIIIHINEGNKYTISEIIKNTDLTKYSKEIDQLIQIKSGDIYNNNELIKIENNIKKMLGNYGYIYPHIILKSIINELNKTIIIKINIYSGKRYYVNKIRFKGNTFSKDFILRREIKQIEGTWLNNTQIEEGKENLNRLNYLKVIEVIIKILSKNTNKVDIIYKIKENNTGNFNFNLGYGTESGVNLQATIQQDNLLGNGYSIRINGSKNNYQNYSELLFINPYFTIDGKSLSNRIFYNNLKTNHIDISNYTNKSYGFENTIGFKINKKNFLYSSLGYIHNDLSNIKPQISRWRYLKSIGKYQNIHNLGKYSTNDFPLNFIWIFNNLNNNYLPTLGNYTTLNTKAIILKSNNKYYKMILDTTQYIPIKNNWILLTHGTLGYTNGFNKKETPFYENFYIGGSNILRGFQSNTIGPKAVYYNSNYFNCTKEKTICNSDDTVGGNAMIISSIALIIPKSFINIKFPTSLRTSIFFDIGTIWDTKWHNTIDTLKYKIPDYSKINNIRTSYGIELQWMSPLGPLVFSYAIPIKKYIGDKIEQFQFNIGKTF